MLLAGQTQASQASIVDSDSRTDGHNSYSYSSDIPKPNDPPVRPPHALKAKL